MITMLDQLNRHECARIEAFKAHLSLAKVESLNWDDLLEILIQRRFLSLSIVNIYEFVIDALESESIKSAVRLILHEEYPRNTRGVPLVSHRELLFRDLLNLGASRDQILMSGESPQTQEVRLQSLNQLECCLGHVHSELALVSFLRFWAEVLVAVEYECLWPRLAERLSPPSSSQGIASQFFYYHMIHDRRQSDLGDGQLLGGLTHAQALARHIPELINGESALQEAMRQVDRAWELKVRFYSQFRRFGSAQASRR